MTDIPKVKRNIQRMIDGGASEAEIDSYVQSEGTSSDELRADMAQVPAGDPDKGDMSKSAMDMLTFGLQPKINAAGAGLIDATIGAVNGEGFNYSDNYNRHLAGQRADQTAYETENPVKANVGKAAGLAAGIATLPAAMPFKGPGMAAGMANGATTGALYGGAGGAAQDANSMAERGMNMAQGGVVGAGLGGAAYPAMRGVTAAWRGVSSWLTNRGVDAKATNEILDMLQQSGMSPQQAEQRLQQMGPDAMLADVAQVEAGGTARASTEAGNLIGSRLEARRLGADARVGSALDDAFGPAVDPYSARMATKAAKKSVNSAYGRAIAAAPQLPQGLPDLLAQGLTHPARGMSLENRQVMGKVMDQLDDALRADTPDEVARRLLDLRKQLDQKIVYDPREKAMLSPADRPAQSVYSDARSYVDEILKDRIPGIAEADAAHAPLSRAQSAFDHGRRAILGGGSETMTPAELAALRSSRHRLPAENTMQEQGVRTELGRIMGNQNANPANTVDRTMRRDWNREKIATMIGPQRSDRLANALDTEATFTETSNLGEASRGSRTNVLESAQRRWGTNGAKTGAVADMAAALVGGTAATGNPVVGAAAAGTVGVNRIRQSIAKALTSKSPDVIRSTADKLTTTGPARDALIRTLTNASNLARNESSPVIRQRSEQIMLRLLGQGAGQIQHSFGGAI